MIATLTNSISPSPQQRMPQYDNHLTAFALDYHAQQVYLRLATDAGSSLGFFKMKWTGNPGRWNLTLRLEPGNYRFRFYAESSRVTTYVSPTASDAARVVMNGLDAVLTVPAGIN